MEETASVRTALAHGPDAPATLVATLRSAPHARPPALVCVFASSRYSLGDVQRRVKDAWPTTTVIGASSAGEFNERSEAPHAISGWALWGDFEVMAAIAEGLEGSPEGVVGSLASDLNERFPTHPHRIGILLLDALSGRGEEATLLAATLLDGVDPVRLVGGAAGDDLAMQCTVVGVDGDVRSDAVALAFLHGRARFGIGVAHGHEADSAPLTVTKAVGNVVYELDGRPAWDVWCERAKAESIDLATLEGDDLARVFFTHSASLATGAEIKVRAPLQRVEDGALSFACGIPEGAVIRLTRSDPSRQLRSAREAARLARGQLDGHDCAGALVFDCVCRKLILSDRFSDAIGAISDVLAAPVAGFETYGEIALDVTDHSGFHNSTTVVLAIPR